MATGTTSQNEEEIIREVLRSTEGSGQSLPTLGPGEVAGYLERLLEAWRPTINNLLKRIFGDGSGLSSGTMEAVLIILMYFVGGVIVVILAFMLFKLCKSIADKRRENSRTEFDDDDAPVDETALEKLLASLLAARAYAAALRIRWKIFLDVKRFQSSMTPFEYAASQQAPSVHPLAEAMFSGAPVEEEEYKAHSGLLGRLEGDRS